MVVLSDVTVLSQPRMVSTFDDTFNEAMQQLIQWGGVVIGEDTR
jgi:hypothetical protein